MIDRHRDPYDEINDPMPLRLYVRRVIVLDTAGAYVDFRVSTVPTSDPVMREYELQAHPTVDGAPWEMRAAPFDKLEPGDTFEAPIRFASFDERYESRSMWRRLKDWIGLP